jgi:hypothetical protein
VTTVSAKDPGPMTRLMLIGALLLAGCGERSVLHPDGGHDPVNCQPGDAHTITVKVVDPNGAPIEGATVTATNQGQTRQVTAQTNGQGVTTAIDESIGPGTVTLKASLDTRVSDVKQVSWTCGECHCTPDPTSVTLTLGP